MIARVRLATCKTLRCRRCRLPLIVRLYETRHDNLPVSGRRDFAPSGFVHNAVHRITCPDCEPGKPSFGCVTCHGRGYTEQMFERDPYSVDHVPAAGTATIKLGHEPSRDAEIARLAAQTRAPFASVDDELADANDSPYAWERARAEMYKRFEYGPLDRALELLHVQHPGVPDLSPYGLAFIDQRMPPTIRAPRYASLVQQPAPKGVSVGDKALRDRDQLVLDLAAQGVSYQDIAKRVGLSTRQLRRVINERSAA